VDAGVRRPVPGRRRLHEAAALVATVVTVVRPTAEGMPIESPGCGKDAVRMLAVIVAGGHLVWRWLR
jgi:hypothetical protein